MDMQGVNFQMLDEFSGGQMDLFDGEQKRTYRAEIEKVWHNPLDRCLVVETMWTAARENGEWVEVETDIKTVIFLDYAEIDEFGPRLIKMHQWMHPYNRYTFITSKDPRILTKDKVKGLVA